MDRGSEGGAQQYEHGAAADERRGARRKRAHEQQDHRPDGEGDLWDGDGQVGGQVHSKALIRRSPPGRS